MNSCGLKSLDNFPNWKSLKVLELSDNKINDTEIEKLTIYENLNTLKLSNNPIKSIESFKKIQNLKIKRLEVIDCPFLKSYEELITKELFKILSSVEVINGYNKEGESVVSFLEEEEEDIEDENSNFISDDLEENKLSDDNEEDDEEDEENEEKK